MPFTVLNAAGGAQTNHGLTPQQLAFLNNEFQASQNQRTAMRTSISPIVRDTYSAISNMINNSIKSWQNVNSYNPSDQNIYYENGLPYKRNGDILIVVSDRTIGSPRQLSGPGFDPRYNQIIIPRSVIDRLMNNEVQALRYSGNPNNETDWIAPKLRDIIIHEAGHRATLGGNVYDAQAKDRVGNLVFDDPSEILQMMGEISELRPISAPHQRFALPGGGSGPIMRFKDGQGNWVRTDLNPTEFYRMWIPSYVPEQQDVILGSNGSYRIVRGPFAEVEYFTTSGRIIGGTVGSALGTYLSNGEGPIVQILTSGVLRAFGSSLADTIQLTGRVGNLTTAANAAFRDFQVGLFESLQQSGLGTVSSLLSLELGRLLVD